jgi:hypothetical protein
MDNTLDFSQITLWDLPRVGGKNASIGSNDLTQLVRAPRARSTQQAAVRASPHTRV